MVLDAHLTTARNRLIGAGAPMAALLLLLLLSMASPAAAAPQGPCDIVSSVGTPCVAAHSTTRILRSGYSGPLYRVTNAAGATLDVKAFAADGIADTSAQDAFCANTTCRITMIYDQAIHTGGVSNDLHVEGAGDQGAADQGALAGALPIRLKGHKVYGILVDPGIGYRDNSTANVPTGAMPETVVMVTSSQHTNSGCCFDYGNTEIVNKDNGAGHMDAVNIGFGCGTGKTCLGSGPWVQADLEDGLYMTTDKGNQNIPYRGETATFVTALLKNDGRTFFTLKSGNAASGGLSFIFKGALPNNVQGNYSPMKKEGGIVLGTGGDNSNRGTGRFFEGFMTNGATPSDTDDTVQANIVAVGYAM